MKKQYNRVGHTVDNKRSWWNDYRGDVWWFRNEHRYYLANPYRGRSRIRTTNERRQNGSALDDGYQVRGKRRNLPTKWDNERIRRDWGRSWKDYTKQKHQYHPAVF